jgi:hypothetical protein
VFHSLLPIFAVAAKRRQPSSSDFKAFLISCANSLGSETKCQPLDPLYCQGFAANSYFIHLIINYDASIIPLRLPLTRVGWLFAT